MQELDTKLVNEMFANDPFYTPLTMPHATVNGLVRMSNVKIGGNAELNIGKGCVILNSRLASNLTIGDNAHIQCLLLTDSIIGRDCVLKSDCFVQNTTLGNKVTIEYGAMLVNCTINSGVKVPASANIARATNISKVCTLTGGSWKTNDRSVLTAYNCDEGVMFFIPGLPRHKHYEKSYTYTEMVKIAKKYLPECEQLINDLDTLVNALKDETPKLHNGWGKGQLKTKNKGI